VTITVDADRGVANQITPATHVDIAVPTPNPDGSNNVTYSYMLTDVKVLAVGASTTQQGAAAAPAAGGKFDRRSGRTPVELGCVDLEVSHGRRPAHHLGEHAAPAGSTWCCSRRRRFLEQRWHCQGAASSK